MFEKKRENRDHQRRRLEVEQKLMAAILVDELFCMAERGRQR